MLVRFNTIATALAALTLTACNRDAPTAFDGDAIQATGTSAFGRSDAVSPWSPAVRVEDIPGTHPSFNGPLLDGCPFIAADDRTFYMASVRDGGLGGIDIWVSTRPHKNAPWGEPKNLGAPINTEHNDFCPTLASDGRTFYFASNRPHGCGLDDLYVTRRSPVGRRDDDDDDDGDDDDDDDDDRRRSTVQWVYEAPKNLGCDVNSSASEHGPSPVYEKGVLVLYFSSARAGGFSTAGDGPITGDHDLYRSVWNGHSFGKAELLAGVNTAFADGQPNVSADARELFFYSNRPGSIENSNDIYSTSRRSVQDGWSTPINLGPNVNSAKSETRPSLSRDGRTLYFGSDRPGPTAEGGADHYVTTRWRRSGDRDD